MPYKDPEKQRRAAWEYTRKFHNYPKLVYNHIKRRINSSGRYSSRRLLIARDTFINWMVSDSTYKRLYQTWAKSGFDHRLTPTVDRIDNNGDYVLDNIQIITRSQNVVKAHYIDHAMVMPSNNVVVKLMPGNLIFLSISDAARSLSVTRQAVQAALHKRTPKVRGYTVEVFAGDGNAPSSDSL